MGCVVRELLHCLAALPRETTIFEGAPSPSSRMSLAVHPNTYQPAGLRRGIATSIPARPETTSRRARPGGKRMHSGRRERVVPQRLVRFLYRLARLNSSTGVAAQGHFISVSSTTAPWEAAGAIARALNRAAHRTGSVPVMFRASLKYCCARLSPTRCPGHKDAVHRAATPAVR
jgi:hypothetical protein